MAQTGSGPPFQEGLLVSSSAPSFSLLFQFSSMLRKLKPNQPSTFSFFFLFFFVLFFFFFFFFVFFFLLASSSSSSSSSSSFFCFCQAKRTKEDCIFSRS